MDDRREAVSAGVTRRLATLRAYGIGPRDDDPTLDALAALAARICRAPRGVVAILDGGMQRNIGLFGQGRRRFELPETVVEYVADRAVDGVFALADRRLDPVLGSFDPVAGTDIVFYANAPLVTPDGTVIGGLVVTCHEPHDITEDERFGLRTLADQVMANLELRRVAASEARAIAALEGRNDVLATALEAERILKMEIDHRVKNSLQLVSSLLQMQAARLSSAEAKEALNSAIGRVRAISFIHGALNRISKMDRVRLSDYAGHLVEELRAQAPAGVTITLEAGEVELPTARASSFAILMNEFVTNSLKHAFPDGRAGTVALRVHEVGGRVRARFADDGVGLSDTAASRREGLGTRLMHALAQQLGCTLEQGVADGGTVLTFEFDAFPRG